MIRGAAVKSDVRSPCVVEGDVAADRLPCFADAFIGVQIDFSYLMVRQKRSTKTLSRHAPLPSMLIEMPLSSSTLVNSALVNWLP